MPPPSNRPTSDSSLGIPGKRLRPYTAELISGENFQAIGRKLFLEIDLLISTHRAMHDTQVRTERPMCSQEHSVAITRTLPRQPRRPSFEPTPGQMGRRSAQSARGERASRSPAIGPPPRPPIASGMTLASSPTPSTPHSTLAVGGSGVPLGLSDSERIGQITTSAASPSFGLGIIRMLRPMVVVEISQSSRSQPTMIPEASRRSNICST